MKAVSNILAVASLFVGVQSDEYDHKYNPGDAVQFYVHKVRMEMGDIYISSFISFKTIVVSTFHKITWVTFSDFFTIQYTHKHCNTHSFALHRLDPTRIPKKHTITIPSPIVLQTMSIIPIFQTLNKTKDYSINSDPTPSVNISRVILFVIQDIP